MKTFSLTFAILSLSLNLSAQSFNSGSDGSDGTLSLTEPGTVLLSSIPGLDADGDGIFNFTDITIADGVIVDFRGIFSGPVIWLATGTATIDGDILLDGQKGHDVGGNTGSLPGAGGFAGGRGATNFTPATNGRGPGGGSFHSTSSCGHSGGGGAGYLAIGQNASSGGSGGNAYGNVFLLPLLGGSGGAGSGGLGSSNCISTGGGAGGGAFLLAANDSLILNGAISVDGGGAFHADPDDVTNLVRTGGGGSGGSIRLIAPFISGSGTVSAKGGLPDPDINGNRDGAAGSPGRIRLETFQIASTITALSPVEHSTPGTVFLTQDQLPVRVTTIGGVAVPNAPTAGFASPDVSINQSGSTTIALAASGVPIGTVITVTVIPESGNKVTVNSTPLAGTIENSTATAEVTIPFGVSRFYIEATF